jgi:hypothetical protein
MKEDIEASFYLPKIVIIPEKDDPSKVQIFASICTSHVIFNFDPFIEFEKTFVEVEKICQTFSSALKRTSEYEEKENKKNRLY